jgi:hypothetical protein
MFEDVDGMEVFVNPNHVVWVREYPGKTTVISCGHEDKFRVRLSPEQAVAALGMTVREIARLSCGGSGVADSPRRTALCDALRRAHYATGTTLREP